VPISIDLTVSILALISLVLSVLTFYVAHVRGPVVELAEHISPYPYHHMIWDGSSDRYTLVSKVVFASTGNRPGILYSVGVDSKDQYIVAVRSDPNPAESLPIALPPGEDWRATVDTYVAAPSGDWNRFLGDSQTVSIMVKYRVSAAFGRKIDKARILRFDTTEIKKHIRKRVNAP
jgi:hypothetical protein